MGGINPELEAPLVRLSQNCERVLACQRNIMAIGNLALKRVDLVLGHAIPDNLSEDAIRDAESFNKILVSHITSAVRSQQSQVVVEGEIEPPNFNFEYRRIIPRGVPEKSAEAIKLLPPDQEPVTFTTLSREVADKQENLIITTCGELLFEADATCITKRFEKFARECERLFGADHFIHQILIGQFQDDSVLAVLLDHLREEVDHYDYPLQVKPAMYRLLDQLPQYALRGRPTVAVNHAMIDDFTAFIDSLDAK